MSFSISAIKNYWSYGIIERVFPLRNRYREVSLTNQTSMMLVHVLFTLYVTSIVIYSETSIKRTPSIKGTLSRVPKLTSYRQEPVIGSCYRIIVIRDQSLSKSLLQNTAQFLNSFLSNMELYHSTEQPLNVNLKQTLRNFYHPLLNEHLGRSRRCPPNRGFTVAGNFFPMARALFGYFQVTWQLTMKVIPAEISERATLQNLWHQRVTVHPRMLTNHIKARFNDTPSKKALYVYWWLYLPCISHHEFKVSVVINVCPNRSIVIQEFSLCDLKISAADQYN